MKILYDLPIRIKFAVVLIPLIVIILCFDYFQIQHNYLDYEDSDRLNKTINLGIEINHVVHELQKERSIAIGYITSNGYQFDEEISRQRDVTDSTLNRFYKELQNPELSEVLFKHTNDIELLKTSFDGIDDIRRRVDKMSLDPYQVLKYFSDINDVALNTVDQLINETRDKDIAQQVHALIYFLKGKERASIERAIGTQAFSLKTMDDELYSTFTSLVAEQSSYTDAFIVIADEDSRDTYSRLVAGHDVDEVERLRGVLHTRTNFEVDPNYWYEMTTNKINALKKVEDSISNRLLVTTSSLAGGALRKFWTFIVLDIIIGVLALWLMSIIVKNLLGNVRLLEEYAVRFSKGDFSKRVTIPTKDEIGHYAHTFNVMAGEIVKSHNILRKERDKAKFLYNNIYRVAMMVFQNIHQGIFLLDRNQKMSKLYSKSMEKIFGVSKIAGENFSNFMRPLIIPRDLEALEMFMRHLFNEDMDEDVVNQLNPIEQVKIYSEKEGLVTTKYIRVNFTRIWRKDKIANIMVTVSDETEAILLQKHLEEAEKKKKQETEQVLSILKIDPSLIRGFLHNAKRTLRSISERYETDRDGNFKELLQFTFETIHNLKGNAVVIGLDIMSQKFHDVEESIDQLKEKDINGKDFLTILYEIDDADKMIDDMSSMLRKVADIYRKYPSGGHVVSNIMLIDSLERAVKVISEKMEKPVDFFFKNDGNLVLPNEKIDSFRDIMIQLIRNSIKHGIEDKAVRTEEGRRGKRMMSIDLNQPDDTTLEVTYKDDGQGLDVEAIKKHAIEVDIISEFEAGKLDEQGIIDLIYKEGFSTAEEVDEHAGRGQGMNLVKNLIEGMTGTFETSFEVGKYFQMTIKLPVNGSMKEEPELDETTDS